MSLPTQGDDARKCSGAVPCGEHTLGLAPSCSRQLASAVCMCPVGLPRHSDTSRRSASLSSPAPPSIRSGTVDHTDTGGYVSTLSVPTGQELSLHEWQRQSSKLCYPDHHCRHRLRCRPTSISTNSTKYNHSFARGARVWSDRSPHVHVGRLRSRAPPSVIRAAPRAGHVNRPTRRRRKNIMERENKSKTPFLFLAWFSQSKTTSLKHTRATIYIENRQSSNLS